MGTYSVNVGDATYEVDAPDENTAWKWANATHQSPKPSARETFLASLPPDRRADAEAAQKLTPEELTKRSFAQETSGLGGIDAALVQFAGMFSGSGEKTTNRIRQSVGLKEKPSQGISEMRSAVFDEAPVSSVAGGLAGALSQFALGSKAIPAGVKPDLAAAVKAHPYLSNIMLGSTLGAHEDGTSGAIFGGLGGALGTAAGQGLGWLGGKAAGVAKGARDIVDTALFPGGAKRAVGRITDKAAGDKKVIEALMKAKAGESAGQASVPAGSAEFTALQRIADAEMPSQAVSRAAQQKAEQEAALALLARGGNQESAIAARDAAKLALRNEVVPKMQTELAAANTAGKKTPIYEEAARRSAGRKVNALQDMGRLVTDEAQALNRAQQSVDKPNLFGWLPKAERNVARAQESGEAAADAATVFKWRKSQEEFANRQLESLAAHGLKPIDTSTLVGSLQAKLNDPSIGVSDINKRAITAVGRKIQEWTEKGGGVIDAQALHEIRKNSVNEVVEKLMRGSDPTSQARRAAAILAETKPAIDKAIVDAGGTGWLKAVNEYEQGMHLIDRQKMGAKALELFQKSPEQFRGLAAGNEPAVVSKIFGTGRSSLSQEMGGAEAPIMNVAAQLERDALEKALGTAGQSKALEIMRMGEKKGVVAPGLIDTKISMTNYALRLLEGRGGKRVNEEMARLMQPENLPELVEVMKAAKPSVRAKLINEMTKHGLKMGGGLTGAILRPDYGQEN